MDVKIYPTGKITLAVNSKKTISDSIDFLQISSDDTNEVFLYMEGDENDNNNVYLNLTFRQAKHLSDALLSIINNDFKD